MAAWKDTQLTTNHQKKETKMQSMNEITMGMTPQERKAYLDHQSMRAAQEVERTNQIIADAKSYKARLVDEILKSRPGVWTKEYLQSRSLGYLERIA